MKLTFFVVLILGLFLLSGIFEQKAYAYLDPGAGSYFFQIIIGILLGGLFTVKLFWRKMVSLFKNLFSRQKHDEQKQN